MSRAARRRERRTGRGRTAAAKQRKPYWIVAAGAIAGLLGVAIYAQIVDPGPHPVVRAAEHHPHVMPASRYDGMVRQEQAYRMAAAVPEVLDGLFCYCFCAEHSGHYSLLDCFASDHGAGCDVCMREAEIAYQMASQGASLDDIRGEIDRIYGA